MHRPPCSTIRTCHSPSDNGMISVNVLTVASHSHDILCVLHDNHHILCLGDQTSVVKTEWHQLLSVLAFDVGVWRLTFSRFYLISRISVYNMTNKRFFIWHHICKPILTIRGHWPVHAYAIERVRTGADGAAGMANVWFILTQLKP